MRYFNTAGSVRDDLHYLIPPLYRFDLDDIMMLIRGRYDSPQGEAFGTESCQGQEITVWRM